MESSQWAREDFCSHCKLNTEFESSCGLLFLELYLSVLEKVIHNTNKPTSWLSVRNAKVPSEAEEVNTIIVEFPGKSVSQWMEIPPSGLKRKGKLKIESYEWREIHVIQALFEKRMYHKPFVEKKKLTDKQDRPQIRSLVDPTLAAFILCRPLQFVLLI